MPPFRGAGSIYSSRQIGPRQRRALLLRQWGGAFPAILLRALPMLTSGGGKKGNSILGRLLDMVTGGGASGEEVAEAQQQHQSGFDSNSLHQLLRHSRRLGRLEARMRYRRKARRRRRRAQRRRERWLMRRDPRIGRWRGGVGASLHTNTRDRWAMRRHRIPANQIYDAAGYF